MKNHMKIEFDAVSANEGFARVSVSAFVTQLDPTLEQLSDIKTALSEAVTNAIIHGYENKGGMVEVECDIDNDGVSIKVSDKGKGIENIQLAMQPLFTEDTEGERSGMGFTVMETFMDSVSVTSKVGEGTDVYMAKVIK